MLGVDFLGLQRSLVHVEVCVWCSGETEFQAESRMTSVMSLTPGPVPAAEPKRLPWATPKGPQPNRKSSAAFPLPSPVPSSRPA